MRVAFVTPFPNDAQLVPGGIAASAQYLVRGLAQQPALDLHVICCQTDVLRSRVEERDGATVHFLPSARRFMQIRNSRPERERIADTLKTIRPDLVHANGLGLPGAAARDSGLPAGVTIHGVTWKEQSLRSSSWFPALRGYVRTRRDRAQIRWARNLFIISDYLVPLLPPREGRRLFFTRNPVSDDIFSIRNEPTAPHVLAIGGTRFRKDPMTTLRAFSHVLRRVPDATLTLLGPPSNSPLDTEVAAVAGSGGLAGRVRVMGLVPNRVLHDEWRRASVLLLTSLEETAPVALAEACAVGVPAVGTDAGGIPFMIRPGRTGFVEPVGDWRAIGERVADLLTDADLRARLAEEARTMGREEFRPAPIASKMVAAWETILDDGVRGTPDP